MAERRFVPLVPFENKTTEYGERERERTRIPAVES